MFSHLSEKLKFGRSKPLMTTLSKYNQYNRISSTDSWWIHLYGHRLAKCIQLVEEMLVQQLNMLSIE